MKINRWDFFFLFFLERVGGWGGCWRVVKKMMMVDSGMSRKLTLGLTTMNVSISAIYQSHFRHYTQVVFRKLNMKYTSLMKIKPPLLYLNYTRGQQSLDYQTPLMEQTWPVRFTFNHKENTTEATTFFHPKNFWDIFIATRFGLILYWSDWQWLKLWQLWGPRIERTFIYKFWIVNESKLLLFINCFSAVKMFLLNDIGTGFSLKCQVFISLPKGG